MKSLYYNDSIIKIKGIGEKTLKTFGRIGIESVQDLLEHYPREYEEFGKPVPIAQVSEGSVATIEAYLGITPRLKRVRNLQILNVQVRDSSGTFLSSANLNVIWVPEGCWPWKETNPEKFCPKS